VEENFDRSLMFMRSGFRGIIRYFDALKTITKTMSEECLVLPYLTLYNMRRRGVKISSINLIFFVNTYLKASLDGWEYLSNEDLSKFLSSYVILKRLAVDPVNIHDRLAMEFHKETSYIIYSLTENHLIPLIFDLLLYFMDNFTRIFFYRLVSDYLINKIEEIKIYDLDFPSLIHNVHMAVNIAILNTLSIKSGYRFAPIDSLAFNYSYSALFQDNRDVLSRAIYGRRDIIDDMVVEIIHILDSHEIIIGTPPMRILKASDIINEHLLRLVLSAIEKMHVLGLRGRFEDVYSFQRLLTASISDQWSNINSYIDFIKLWLTAIYNICTVPPVRYNNEKLHVLPYIMAERSNLIKMPSQISMKIEILSMDSPTIPENVRVILREKIGYVFGGGDD